MNWLMIVCLLTLLWGAVSGWKNGLLKELLSTGGFFVGLVLAYYFHDRIAGGGAVGFIVIMIGAPIILGLIATLLSGILDHVFLVGKANRLAGALLGAAKWAFFLYCIYYVGHQVGLL